MEFKAKEIAEILNGTVEGNPEARISAFARIENGKPGTICFFANPKYEHYVYECKADIIIVNNSFEPQKPVRATMVRVENAYAAIAQLLDYVTAKKRSYRRHRGFRSKSYFSTRFGKKVYLGDFSHVGRRTVIGDYTKIWRECVKNCRIVGHIAARHNLQFTYHNHHQEFVLVDGIVAQDRIYASTDPEEVKFELDVYWIKKRGADPVEYIRRFTGRLPQIHLKDMAADDGSFTELGCGVIDLPGCIAAAREGDCRWLIYEQDACRRDPLESAAISINCLKTLVGR